jgi:hypothetical protein
MLVDDHALYEIIKVAQGVFRGVVRGCVLLTVYRGSAAPGHTFRGLLVAQDDLRASGDLTLGLRTLLSQRGTRLAQDRARTTLRRTLTVNIENSDEAFLEKIQQRKIDWWNLVERGRGIELNSDGNILQCPECLLWDAPPKPRNGIHPPKVCSHCGHRYEFEDARQHTCIIHESYPTMGMLPYLDGSDLSRYSIARIRSIDLSRKGIQYKDSSLYRSPKILFRQVGVGVTASLDSGLSAYVPQSVYILRLASGLPGPEHQYRIGYILGVLNSRLMAYFVLRETGQTDAQSFSRWTMGRVFELPVRAINWADEREVILHEQIADRVDKILQSVGAKRAELDLLLEQDVLSLYQVTAEEWQRIVATLRSVRGVHQIESLVLPSLDFSFERGAGIVP